MKIQTQTKNLATQLRSNNDAHGDLREDTAKAIEEMGNLIGDIPDNWTYRIVVIGIVLTVLSVAVGGIVLAARTIDIPDAVIALGATAIGGLVGLLAPSPK